jgi:hypothetical protein
MYLFLKLISEGKEPDYFIVGTIPRKVVELMAPEALAPENGALFFKDPCVSHLVFRNNGRGLEKVAWKRIKDGGQLSKFLLILKEVDKWSDETGKLDITAVEQLALMESAGLLSITEAMEISLPQSLLEQDHSGKAVELSREERDALALEFPRDLWPIIRGISPLRYIYYFLRKK